MAVDINNSDININVQEGLGDVNNIMKSYLDKMNNECDQILAQNPNNPQAILIKEKIASGISQYDIYINQLNLLKGYKKFYESPSILNVNEYAQKAVELIWQYILSEREAKNLKETYTNDNMKGIWQIIKFVFDEDSEYGVANRRVVDQSIGNENGTLMGFIDKVCQDPFVEFYGDTYYDKYFFITRQPPFTQQPYQDLIDFNIEIEEKDILNESLGFDTGKAYSWYRLRPQNLISYLGDASVFAYLKAVHFKEYADVWGERPLEQVSNYLEFNSIIGNKKDLLVFDLVKQSINDLKFMVDTNAYLPFTRTGTMLLNGDRRIKRGMVVYKKSTDEVFYVDSVSHSYSINNGVTDRTTTINVSRGMVKEYFPLYFKIVNTPVEDIQQGSYIDQVRNLYKEWQTNKFVFNFFLTKQQFEPGQIDTIKLVTKL